ncbi:transmembrane protein 272-like [Coregonus clupeaformis]|nr:transmembrane protein 272-like [Coregonus clupeaformis]
MGAFGLALALLSCLPCAQDSDGIDPNPLNHLCTTWSTLASFFLFCWFISGNVWIYSIYQPNFNQTLTEDPYCNKTLYLFAFWTTTLAYVVLGLLLLGGCCMLVCAFVLGKSDPDDNRA